MKEKNTKKIAIMLIFCFAAILTSCKDNSQTPIKNDGANSIQINFETYAKSGLELSFPSHWQFEFDEEPSPYGKRGIGFQASELSAAFIYITHNEGVSIEEFSNLLTSGLNTFGNDIVDLEQSPVNSGAHQGKKLSWTNKMLGTETKVELTIFKIQDAPNSVFAVINLSDEDITSEGKLVSKFVNSISYN